MFCPECGYPLPDGVSKCEYCGHEFHQTSAVEKTSYLSGGMNKTVGISGGRDDGVIESYEGEYDRADSHKSENDRTDFYQRDSYANHSSVTVSRYVKLLVGFSVVMMVVGIISLITTQISVNSIRQESDQKTGTGFKEDPDTYAGAENLENTEGTDFEENENGEKQSPQKAENSATPTPTPTPTPYPLSAIKSHVTDAEPSDIGEYRRPAFVSAEASSSLVQEKHPEYDNSAKSIIDGNYITSWQDGDHPNDGTGQKLWLSFDEERKIHYLEFKLGNWRTKEYYDKNCRPKQIELEIDGTRFTLDFTDAMISHYVEFSHPVKAKELNFKINSVYKGTEVDDCCIAEIVAYTE